MTCGKSLACAGASSFNDSTMKEKTERAMLLLGTLFFQAMGYFLLNWLAQSRAAFSVQLPLDDKIPFLPIFVIPYVAMYFVEFLPFFLIRDRQYLRRVTLCYLGVISLTFIFFAFLPVQMHRPSPEILGSAFWHQLLGFIYRMDLPYNTFPSQHVLLTLLAGLAISKESRIKGIPVILGAVVISTSTLLVKQHYVLDVVAGALLAIAGYYVLTTSNALTAYSKFAASSNTNYRFATSSNTRSISAAFSHDQVGGGKTNAGHVSGRQEPARTQIPGERDW